MAPTTHRRLSKRAGELRTYMYSLECGDNYLFSNRNGNLDMYQAWGRELKGIDKQLDKGR